jgi:hypothetical protein
VTSDRVARHRGLGEGICESRQGFALAAALLSMLLIAALMVSVFFAANEQTRIGAASAGKQLALSTAESAIQETIGNWMGSAGDSIGVAGTRSSVVGGSGMPVTVSVTRLDSTIYWIVAEAGRLSSSSAGAKRIGAIVTVKIAPDHSTSIDRVPERWWSEVF